MSDSDTHTEAQTWEFELPSLGADMDQGIVLEWYVAPDDSVSRGDLVVRVETEKSDIDVEIWHPGTVAELLVEVGDEIPVGTPILRMTGEPSDNRTEAKTPAAEPEPPQLEPAPSQPPQPTQAPQSTPAHQSKQAPGVLASPLARAAALESGLDLADIAGSGPGGAVLRRDVKHGQPAQPPPESVAVAPADRMRQAIAERMAKANQEIPHYHLDLDVDVGDTLDWLEKYNESLAVAERVLPAALFLKATAAAAASQPALNGYWSKQHFQQADGIHLGVAVSLRKGGLVTPVIRDADQQSLSETMAVLKEMVTGARSGSLRSRWMSEGSITVTNLGDNGADKVHGVIFPPQVALVGFGRVRRQPWVVDNEVVPRPVVTVSLAADHRATDGATGSRFLESLAHHLQHPEDL